MFDLFDLIFTYNKFPLDEIIGKTAMTRDQSQAVSLHLV